MGTVAVSTFVGGFFGLEADGHCKTVGMDGGKCALPSTRLSGVGSGGLMLRDEGVDLIIRPHSRIGVSTPIIVV